MADRMTDRERQETRNALAKLKSWEPNSPRIKTLEMRLRRDAEANAKDEIKGRHRRVR